eukprot:scaffold10020_cov122-Isochrysis_galbana.AAC.9
MPAAVEKLEQIVELAVDVAADGDGALHRLHRRLFEHELLDVLAEMFQVQLGEQFALLDILDPPIEPAAVDGSCWRRPALRSRCGGGRFVFRSRAGGG